MRELIYRGGSKDVYRLAADLVEIQFTDGFSIYRGNRYHVPGKGRSLCNVACFWFEIFKSIGLPVHYVERKGETSLIAHACFSENSTTTPAAFPIECVTRHYVAGSLHERILQGKFDAVGEAQFGDKLPEPFFEIGPRNGQMGKYLSPTEMDTIPGATEMKSICLEADRVIADQLRRTNCLHVDGKKEFGLSSRGALLLVDACGTLEEDRFWWDGGNERVNLSLDSLRRRPRSLDVEKLSNQTSEKYKVIEKLQGKYLLLEKLIVGKKTTEC
jgi:phosphoribosylaminoimidazole-succinocarboxamide synthase